MTLAVMAFIRNVKLDHTYKKQRVVCLQFSLFVFSGGDS
jgi:hypothetical protein